jgi:hypothetical protein
LSSLRTQSEVRELNSRVISQAEVVAPFENLNLGDGASMPIFPGSSETEESIPLWLGDTITSGLDGNYITWRSKLSDAAKDGNWASLFQILDVAKTDYSEPWINCIRLSRSSIATVRTSANRSKEPPVEAGKASGWTVLHQAAYMCAPKETVREMLDLGAWSESIGVPYATADRESRNP